MNDRPGHPSRRWPAFHPVKAWLKALLGRNRRRTYSQFGEDAYLQSYFRGKHWVRGRGTKLPGEGFYVDIGAFSPTEGSNTYEFYRNGWRGINVDATPGVMSSFRMVRPRDTNLHLAVGDAGEALEFYVFGQPSVFNTADPALAAEREAEFGVAPTVVRVACMPLADLLAEHLPPGQRIDFLTVDVEGLDLRVLRSNDWDRFRPELVVAELEGDDVRRSLESDMVAFMAENDYAVLAWLPPSIVFRDRRR